MPVSRQLILWMSIILTLSFILFSKLREVSATAEESLPNETPLSFREILAEPIQTIMRKNKIKNPYEKLKDLTRGNKNINKESLHKFIKLHKLPKEDKDYLLNLTPQNYIGIASSLARKFK